MALPLKLPKAYARGKNQLKQIEIYRLLVMLMISIRILMDARTVI